MNIEELNKKLDSAVIKSRSQNGVNLSYIEGHHAIREANRIFGFDGWTRKTLEVSEVQSEQVDNKWRVSYTCRSEIVVENIVRQGVGFGQGIDKDLGRAHESAIKEAETDAMKRAMMTFGDPFGLALYDKAREHVEEAPKQYESAPAEKKPPTMHEKTAGKYIKDELKLNPADFKKFQALCNLSGNDWVSIALANKESDDGTVETLMERATVKEVPLNGQQLAETVREIFNA